MLAPVRVIPLGVGGLAPEEVTGRRGQVLQHDLCAAARGLEEDARRERVSGGGGGGCVEHDGGAVDPGVAVHDAAHERAAPLQVAHEVPLPLSFSQQRPEETGGVRECVQRGPGSRVRVHARPGSQRVQLVPPGAIGALERGRVSRVQKRSYDFGQLLMLVLMLMLKLLLMKLMMNLMVLVRSWCQSRAVRAHNEAHLQQQRQSDHRHIR